MILHRLDDYQSWLVTHGDLAILVDPWLTDEPITGSFDRRHGDDHTTVTEIAARPERLAAILLCTGVNDHTRPRTLAQFPDVPVHGPVAAAKAARRAGCSSTHVVDIDRPFEFTSGACSLVVTPTRTGLPLGLIANGYVIEARRDDRVEGRLWIEPHQPKVAVARSIAPIDAAVLPTSSVTAVVLPVTAGLKRSLRVATASRAHRVIATATDPRRDMSWWQKSAYFVGRGRRRLRQRAADDGRLLVLSPRASTTIGSV